MRSLLVRVCSRYANTAVWSRRQRATRTRPLHSFTTSAIKTPHPELSRHFLSSTSRLASSRSMATGSDPPPAPEKSLNRLANEKSPYLLQHASNPVDWSVVGGAGRKSCTLFYEDHTSLIIPCRTVYVQSVLLLACSYEVVMGATMTGVLEAVCSVRASSLAAYSCCI